LNEGKLKRKDGEGDIGHPTQFDFCEFRERDWANVLTAHSKASESFLWGYENHAISKVAVESASPKEKVTAVCVSHCGNFGVLGYQNGHI